MEEPSSTEASCWDDAQATASYIRRTLCAHRAMSDLPSAPIQALLPPLTSSNDVDLQLYAIIAVVLKQLVLSWYGRLTPDQAFVAELLQIIAHCSTALEQRLRSVDLEALVLDEMPDLVFAHISAYRVSHRPCFTSGLVPDRRSVYHALRPHPALALPPTVDGKAGGSDDEQERNEQLWRQLLVQGILAILLPTEDLANDSLSVFLQEILAELMIGKLVAQQLAEPCTIWNLLASILSASNSGREQESDTSLRTRTRRTRMTSTPGTRTTNRLNSPIDNHASDSITHTSNSGTWPLNTRGSWVSAAFLVTLVHSILNYSLAFFSLIPLILPSITFFQSLPRREPKAAMTMRSTSLSRPIVSMQVWAMLASLIDLHTIMPWLTGMVSLARTAGLDGPGKIIGTNSVLDRYLSHVLATRLFNSSCVVYALRTVRRILLPFNTFPHPASQKRVEDEVERAQVRSRCASAILQAMPVAVRSIYFGRSDEAEHLERIKEWLDVFGDPYMNKHLLFALLELLIVRLFPELSERGPSTILEERLCTTGK